MCVCVCVCVCVSKFPRQQNSIKSSRPDVLVTNSVFIVRLMWKSRHIMSHHVTSRHPEDGVVLRNDWVYNPIDVCPRRLRRKIVPWSSIYCLVSPYHKTILIVGMVTLRFARFPIHAVTLNITIFWGVTPCSLVNIWRCSEELISSIARLPLFLFVYTTTHCSLKAYCAIWVRRSNFRHQTSPRVSPRESTQRRKMELWARNVR